jgi:hypothetical protein
MFASTPNPEVCPCATPSEQDDCPHDNTSWDPGNYLPPFGWEQSPGMFCDDCGKEMEEEDITEDITWGDPYYDVTSSPEELAEEARNPL